jgi:adenylate kinase family enzyme
MVIVLFGAPGVGKGTQAQLLSQRYGIAHLSTGEAFRQAIQQGTPLGKQVQEYVHNGLLVPDELATAVVAELLAQSPYRERCILDGFPRTLQQAYALDELLAQQGRSVELVINICVAEEEIVRRLLARGRPRRHRKPSSGNGLPSTPSKPTPSWSTTASRASYTKLTATPISRPSISASLRSCSTPLVLSGMLRRFIGLLSSCGLVWSALAQYDARQLPLFLQAGFEKQPPAWGRIRWVNPADYRPEELSKPSDAARLLYSPTGIPLVNIAPYSMDQSETWITLHHRNPQLLLAGANDSRYNYGGNYRMVSYRSTDGGRTWSAALTPRNELIPTAGGAAIADPGLAFDNAGNAYYGHIMAQVSGSQLGGTNGVLPGNLNRWRRNLERTQPGHLQRRAERALR